ncbi:MAG: tetratricopeptide repeat protein [bacterium]|nr:tetratricopeptide repeat protein [bacterium]
MRVGGLGKDDVDAFLRTPHKSHAVVWELTADAVAEVFERLGGDKKQSKNRRGRAHPLGMVLLATLAAAQGETPHDVVRRHPDLFAEALEKKIFHELYDDVLNDAEGHLLRLCALYRDEIPVRHEAALQEQVGDGGEKAFDALLDRCLLRSDTKQERFSLHQMIGDLVRRRLDPDDDDVVKGRHRIGELWLGDAKGLRRLPQILAASEAVYHLVRGDGWELLADVQGRLLQDDVVAELRAVSKELHRRRRDQEYRRVLELLLAADENDHMSHRFLAEAIEKLEERGSPAAFPHYEKAYELKPSFAPYVNNLMRYLETGDPQRCVAIGEKAIAGGVADDYILAVLAKVLEGLGREDEASALRQERIEAKTQHPAIYNDEAVLLDKQGRKDEALRVLALAFERGLANPHIRSVRDRLVGGDAASASRQKEIEDGTTDPVVYNDQAVFLDNAGRTDEALDVLRLAVDRGVADDHIYAVQARLLEKTGAEDKASRLRRQRIDAGSRDPFFYNDEAILLDKQGRIDEALDVLRLAGDRGLEDDYIRRTHLRLERKVSSPV